MDKALLDEYLHLMTQPPCPVRDLRLVALWRSMTPQERQRRLELIYARQCREEGKARLAPDG